MAGTGSVAKNPVLLRNLDASMAALQRDLMQEASGLVSEEDFKKIGMELIREHVRSCLST